MEEEEVGKKAAGLYSVFQQCLWETFMVNICTS